jgi:hypothetical protein
MGRSEMQSQMLKTCAQTDRSRVTFLIYKEFSQINSKPSGLFTPHTNKKGVSAPNNTASAGGEQKLGGIGRHQWPVQSFGG